jgi:DNA-binding beta-propeller fold protein YncE
MRYFKKWQNFLLLVALLLTGLVTTSVTGATGGDGTIVVANRAGGDLTLIDVATDTATTLAMPGGTNPAEPMYVVHKAGKVFVGDRANNRIVVFDSADWSVVGEVLAGNGVFHMWAQPNGNQLWVNNDIDNTITVINTDSLAVITTIDLPADLVADGGKPHDVILSNKSAYVTMLGLSGANDVVIRYDLRRFEERARADVGKDPHVTIDPKNGRLYVAAQNSNEVRVLRRHNLSLVTTLTIPGAHGIDIRADGDIVYVTNISGGGTDALYTLDTQSNTLIGNPVDTPFATPHNIVLTGSNEKLYVTHSGATADQVSVFTVSKQNPEPVFLTSVTAGLNPFGIEFVP